MVYHPLQAMTERKSSIDTCEVPLVAFRPGQRGRLSVRAANARLTSVIQPFIPTTLLINARWLECTLLYSTLLYSTLLYSTLTSES